MRRLSPGERTYREGLVRKNDRFIADRYATAVEFRNAGAKEIRRVEDLAQRHREGKVRIIGEHVEQNMLTHKAMLEERMAYLKRLKAAVGTNITQLGEIGGVEDIKHGMKELVKLNKDIDEELQGRSRIIEKIDGILRRMEG